MKEFSEKKRIVLIDVRAFQRLQGFINTFSVELRLL
jgi:hypothetical protein